MKITVEHYDKKISIEENRDDLTLAEFMELITHLAMGMGYSQETIDKYFEE